MMTDLAMFVSILFQRGFYTKSFEKPFAFQRYICIVASKTQMPNYLCRQHPLQNMILDENNYCLGGCYLDQACAQWVDDSHCPVLYCVKQDLDENNHYRAAGYDAK